MPEQELFKGLQALAESAFPKRCSYCEKIYQTLEEYLADTADNKDERHFEYGQSSVGKALKLYRVCSCGSSLVDYFQDRRDLSDRGDTRRQAFEKVIAHLLSLGFEKTTARTELLKVMRGEGSDVLAKHGVNLGGGAKQSA